MGGMSAVRIIGGIGVVAVSGVAGYLVGAKYGRPKTGAAGGLLLGAGLNFAMMQSGAATTQPTQ